MLPRTSTDRGLRLVGQDRRVVGFHTLASPRLTVTSGVGRFRCNMPDPIPVAVLGHLAVDRSQQGEGPCRTLFRDYALRVALAADVIGIRCIVVHAISGNARALHLALDFDPSPAEPMPLMVALGDIRLRLGHLKRQ